MPITMTSDPRAAFNRETALQRISGDERLLHDLASFYIEDAPVLVSQLQAALLERDKEAVTHAAHTLKSLSANLDAHRAAALAEILERSGRMGELTVAADLAGDLETAIDAVVQCLKETYPDLH
jgi:HPt (histidine-containing phosphotransfer) domain-containing protein